MVPSGIAFFHLPNAPAADRDLHRFECVTLSDLAPVGEPPNFLQVYSPF